MSEGSGSILQLQPKTTALSNVNLLIVADHSADVQAISKTLKSAGVNFTYDTISISKSANGNFVDKKYNAILYNHYLFPDYQISESPLEKLKLFSQLYQNTPLILITDVLGDETAVELIQSGISGYILRHKIYKLPDVLKTTLVNFILKKRRYSKQIELIQQQQEHIKKLEAEKQSWETQETARQEHISHLNHELRSPISSIMGFAGMLKEQFYGPLNPKQLQYVSALLTVGQHLLDLVNNYLDLAKIEANKQTLELEKLTVEDVCQASLFIVSEKAREKQLELILKLGDNIDFCVADSVRLKQILVNLLSNGVKFTAKGSVTLQVNLQQDTFDFAVIDTGMGISTANLEKLFQPFQQLTNHHEGTGLGLALSRKLAQLHGGDITVTSEIGKGSCFTLQIPRHIA